MPVQEDLGPRAGLWRAVLHARHLLRHNGRCDAAGIMWCIPSFPWVPPLTMHALKPTPTPTTNTHHAWQGCSHAHAHQAPRWVCSVQQSKPLPMHGTPPPPMNARTTHTHGRIKLLMCMLLRTLARTPDCAWHPPPHPHTPCTAGSLTCTAASSSMMWVSLSTLIQSSRPL